MGFKDKLFVMLIYGKVIIDIKFLFYVWYDIIEKMCELFVEVLGIIYEY